MAVIAWLNQNRDYIGLAVLCCSCIVIIFRTADFRLRYEMKKVLMREIEAISLS